MSLSGVGVGVFVLAPGLAAAQQKDDPACKGHPLFNRMPGYWIHSCAQKEFDAFAFTVGKGKTERVERRFWRINYYPQAKRDSTPRELQIQRNFEAAVTKLGGTVVLSEKGKSTLRLTRDGKEFWIEVSAEFTGKHGVAAARVKAYGVGPLAPVAPPSLLPGGGDLEREVRRAEAHRTGHDEHHGDEAEDRRRGAGDRARDVENGDDDRQQHSDHAVRESHVPDHRIASQLVNAVTIRAHHRARRRREPARGGRRYEDGRGRQRRDRDDAVEARIAGIVAPGRQGWPSGWCRTTPLLTLKAPRVRVKERGRVMVQVLARGSPAHAPAACAAAGLMFWFTLKKFAGSYFALIRTRRS
ncbi:MAG TPA: hypothetical protein VGK32_15020 [Vicinamibacterales bacterium]|jgi:hypothetical protein